MLGRMTTPEPVAPVTLSLGPRAGWVGVGAYGFAASVFLAALVFESIVNTRFPLAGTGWALPGGPTLADSNRWGTIGTAGNAQAWRAASLLLIGLSVGAVAVAGLTLRTALRERPWPTLVLLATGVVVAGLAGFIHTRGPTSYLVEMAQSIERSSEILTRTGWADLLVWPKRFGEIVAGLVGVAMTSVLLLPDTVTASAIAERVRRLRLVLYVSGAMLILGVVVTRTSYGWAAATTSSPEQLDGVLENGTRLAASFYSLMLAAGYVPTALVLQNLSARLADEAVRTGQAQTNDQWLTDQRLKGTIKGQVAVLLTIMAPLLSAVAPQLLELVRSV